MKDFKKIAVLTSGGDAPGMNAAIRAVVRTAIYQGLEVYGVRHGYLGLVNGDIFRMKTTDVSNIIQRGGTILKTARSDEFKKQEGRKKAYNSLKKHNIDALVVIGGDGSFKGAQLLTNEFPDMRAIGIPGTIDNDIAGTDYTIGFDTAVNTAVEAIDKIRDTAEAHDRTFIVEVMGRDAGFIALHSGIACGAEDILIPETHTNIDQVLKSIWEGKRRKKLVNIIIVAEGDDFGGAIAVENAIKERFPKIDARAVILGHIQRGGSPSYFDRTEASKLGYTAVNALLEGKQNVMVGWQKRKIIFTPFEKAIKQHAKMSEDLIKMAKVLSS